MDKFWIVWQHDGLEGRPVSYWRDRENAIACAKGLYEEEVERRKTAYGPESERPSPKMIWPDEPIPAPKVPWVVTSFLAKHCDVLRYGFSVLVEKFED